MPPADAGPPADEPVAVPADAGVERGPAVDVSRAGDEGTTAAGRVSAEDAVSWPVRVTAAWAWRGLVVAAAVYVLLQVLSKLTLIVFPVAVALLLSALFSSGVARLRRWGVRKNLATTLVFVTGIALVAGVLALMGTALAEQLPDISSSAQQGVQEVQKWLARGPFHLSQSQLDSYSRQVTDWVASNRGRLTSGAIGAAGTAAEGFAAVFLCLFTTFFFLADGEHIWSWVVRLFPRRAEDAVREAGVRAWTSLVGYVRGVVIIAAIDAVGVGIVLGVLSVPLAVPLAILVFLGAFVPLVGATLTGLVAVLVALVTKGPVTALIVAAGIVAVQQIEGHLLHPLVMSRFVRLHPLGIALAVTTGAVLAGIGGAVVAVPVAAVLTTVLGYFAERARATPPQSDRPAPAGTITGP